MEEKKGTDRISKRLLAFNAILALLIVWFIFAIYSARGEAPVTTGIEFPETAVNPDAFNGVVIEGQAAYVYDVTKNEVIYKKNEFTQLPLASITKLMTVLTAAELIPENSEVTIRSDFLKAEGDSGLLANESWRMKDLLDFSLVVSSNDGARAVASVVGALNLNTLDYELGRKEFVAKMNENAQKLGLKQTFFINESGLDEGGMSGGYGSVIDVTKLLHHMMQTKPEILEATRYADLTIRSSVQNHNAENTNTDTESIPNLIASKTGFTNLAGGNLVIAFDASMGRPVIIVVLGSTIDGRFTDVSKLVKATQAYISGI